MSLAGMIQTLLKLLWQFLKELNINLKYAVFLGITQDNETLYFCTCMLIVSIPLFLIVSRRKYLCIYAYVNV